MSGVRDALTLELGPAIAKILASHLLGGSAPVAAATALIDIIKSRILPAREVRKVDRLFADVGERVADSVFALFEGDNAPLDDDTKEVIVLAVAQTMNAAAVDPALLANMGFNAEKLRRHICASFPVATRGYSERERAAYERIIDELSQRITDIAKQCPQFHQATSNEILRQTERLVSATDAVFAELERIRANIQLVDPSGEHARFRVKFGLAAARFLDQLRLFGVGSPSARSRQSLSIAYISLSVARQRHRGADRRQDRTEQADETSTTLILSTEQTLKGARRLLVRGTPGSGKTTLLQWIGVHSATSNFPKALENWNGTTPFLVRLREFAKSELPDPEDLPKLLTPLLAGAMPTGWVHQELASGRAIVMLDGVDEIPSTRRAAVKEWLEGMITAFPEARYVVTSRLYAADDTWLADLGFENADLLPMDLADIRTFVDHWHLAAAERYVDNSDADAVLECAQALKRTITGNLQLRSIAVNPLLCAMICTLHLDRNKMLPSRRLALYDACVAMLLERRDPERGVSLDDYPTLAEDQRRYLLESFAYTLVKNRRADMLTGETDQYFDNHLKRMVGLEEGRVTGTLVRKHLVERTGLIRETVSGRVDFAHRTFQEFLAARAAVDEGDIELLVQNAHDDQWRETIVLASGMLRDKQADRLVEGIVKRGDNVEKYATSLHLLAVACLETLVTLDPKLKERVGRRIERVLPPRSILEASQIASAGDLATRFLVREDSRSAETNAACVRALSTIGTESALAALETYSDETDKNVVSELIRALDCFGPKQRVQALVSTVRTFQCGTAKDLLKLGALTGLEVLEIANIDEVRLSDVPRLERLQVLRLRFCEHVYDLDGLEAHENLRRVELIGCRHMKDLRGLGDLPALREVSIVECDAVSDLSWVVRTKKLAELELVKCRGVLDASGVGHAARLTRLKVEEIADRAAFAWVAKLQALEELILERCADVRRLTFLEHTSRLRSIELLRLENVEELGIVAKAATLESVRIEGCARVRNLMPLCELPRLKQLSFVGDSNTRIPRKLRRFIPEADGEPDG
jgi:hypothetical protein